jgi:HAD superfamily hydrolase (TIGR01509 family)
MQLRAVVFDMDGTLTVSPLDFAAIRAECGVPPGQPVLESIENAPEPDRQRMLEVLDRHEREAALACTLRNGARELLEELTNRNVKTALLTRNSAESVRMVLARFGLRFDCWLSRGDAAPKPSPEPVLKIARQLGMEPQEMLVVGDYVFDMQAGRAAGARTAFLKANPDLAPPLEAEVVIDDLRQILSLLPVEGR